MATLNAGTGGAVRFDTLNIAGWLTGTPAISTPTVFFINGAGYRQFDGTGFTYGADGFFNGGTVTSIYFSPPAGGTPHHFAGLSMPVATLSAHVNAGDSAGFLAAVFAGNDTLRGNNGFAFDDYLDGYAGSMAASATILSLAAPETIRWMGKAASTGWTAARAAIATMSITNLTARMTAVRPGSILYSVRVSTMP